MAKTRNSDIINQKKTATTQLTKQHLRKGEYYLESQGYYYCYYYDEEQNRKKIKSKTLEGLREKKADIDNRKAQGLKVGKSNRTLDSFYEEWILNKTGLVAHTVANYTWVYEHYVKGTKLGKTKIQDITTIDIMNHYVKYCMANKQLSVSTCDGIQTVLRQVFQYAVRKQFLIVNPAEGAITDLKRQTRTEQAHPALTKAQQDRFLSFMKDHPVYHHWHPIFSVMLGTGMRISEVAGLRHCDINMEKGIIKIDHNLLYYQDKGAKKMTHKVGKTKTKASKRVVAMIDGVKEAFEEQEKWIKDSGITCQCVIKGEPDAPEEWYTDFIFLNRDGMPYHQGTLNKAIGKIVRDANIEAEANPDKKIPVLPHFSCHCLRSSFVTRCAEKNLPIEITMKMVGHSDRKTTMNVYTTVHEDWLTREISAINDLF